MPENALPVVSADVDCTRTSCRWTAAASDPDGTITTPVWQFSDGVTISGTTAARSLPAAGTYTGTVTVTDDDGASASATASVRCVDRGRGRATRLLCQ